MPRVSIIIPTFNCARFLGQALQSVFEQTYADYEIVVVDDGSTDGTRELLAPLSDKIHYVYQSNRGLPSARNVGVSKSSGEFLAYLDADDKWYPRKLEHQVAFMDVHPECGLVHSDLTLMDEDDRLIFPDWYRKSKGSHANGFCVMELLQECFIQVPTVIERRICFDRVGGFDERFRRLEDYLHWLQIVLDGYAVGYVDEPLAMYRLRTGSLTGNQAAMAEATIEMFRVLVEENALSERLGSAAEELVRSRVAALRGKLPYYYRQQGRNDLARQTSTTLIRQSPGDLHQYVELMKSCVPQSLARALRGFRELWG
jgi:glycosyltransferase involved in cell wall biosynthesis